MTDTARIAYFGTRPFGPRSLWTHLDRAVLRRAALVAVILGCILTLANQPGAVFRSAELALLPLFQVTLTPFAVVAVSQLLGARQAAAEALAGRRAAETFLSTVMTHGIPFRAVLLALAVGGVNTVTAAMAALLDQGNLNGLPLPLLAQAFCLPLVFGALSQAIAFRRTARAFVPASQTFASQ